MTDAAGQDRVTVCHPAEDQMLLDFLAAQRATALDIVAGLDEAGMAPVGRAVGLDAGRAGRASERRAVSLVHRSRGR